MSAAGGGGGFDDAYDRGGLCDGRARSLAVVGRAVRTAPSAERADRTTFVEDLHGGGPDAARRKSAQVEGASVATTNVTGGDLRFASKLRFGRQMRFRVDVYFRNYTSTRNRICLPNSRDTCTCDLQVACTRVSRISLPMAFLIGYSTRSCPSARTQLHTHAPHKMGRPDDRDGAVPSDSLLPGCSQPFSLCHGGQCRGREAQVQVQQRVPLSRRHEARGRVHGGRLWEEDA